MLTLANNVDRIVDGVGIAVMIAAAGVTIASFVYFIAGFVQMKEGENWDGLNVTGFGAIGLTISYIFFYVTISSFSEMSIYQAVLAGTMFSGLYVIFVALLRFCHVPYGIIFLVGLTFVATSI